MKRFIHVAIAILLAADAIGEDRAVTSSVNRMSQEWRTAPKDLSPSQFSVVLFTNRFCPFTNLLQIAHEASGEEFRNLTTISASKNASVEREPDFRLFITTNENSISLNFRVSTDGLEGNSLRNFRRKTQHFADLRQDGMSAAYAMDSLRVAQEFGDELPKPNEFNPNLSARELIKRRFWVPEHWIADSYSTENAVFVIDTNFVFKFHPIATPKRYDAKEFDPKLGPLIAATQIEVMKVIPHSSPWEIWGVAQRTLRERLAIEWASPADLNSDPLFNLVLTNVGWVTNR